MKRPRPVRLSNSPKVSEVVNFRICNGAQVGLVLKTIPLKMHYTASFAQMRKIRSILIEWILDNEMIYIRVPEWCPAQEYMLSKGNNYCIIQKNREDEWHAIFKKIMIVVR